jgi:BlaI family transcriptional regulator, penicillinase repressor
MTVLWQSGSCTVQDVQRHMPTTPPLAYNTVQTVLAILHRKGWVKRRLVGKAHVYAATATRDRTARQMLRELIDKVFGGSPTELVMAMVGSQQLTRTEIRRIAAVIRKHERESR